MRLRSLLSSALLLSPMVGRGVVRAQLLDLSAGASSMYQSQGGTVVLRGTNYETGVSAGTVGGHLLAGGHLAYEKGPTRLMLGMEQVGLDLPTDVLGGGHRLIGLGADLKTVRWGMAAEFFAGATSTRFESPLVQAAVPDQVVGALLLRRSLTSKIALSTQLLFSPETLTVLQSIAWKARPSLQLGLTAGVGAGKRYGAVSAVVKRPRLDLSAAYMSVAAGFRRTGSQTDPAAEAVRENLLFTVRSSQLPRFTLSGGRQNMMALPASPAQSGVALVPAAAVPTIATIDELSGYLRLAKAGVSGSVLHSTYRGKTDLGLVTSVNLPVTRLITAGASYFESRLISTPTPQTPVRFGVGHLQEILNNRWTATQTVTVAGAQTTSGFGGTFLSNFATISTDYETFFLPTRPENPFQQSMVLDLRFNLFGRLQLHAGSFVSPQGKLLYTVDGHGVLARRGTFVPTVEQANLSRFVVVGDVRDTAGDAVEGAAIRIEGQVLYSNSGGRFIFREKKEAAHELTVMVDQFLDGEHYTVISKPETVTSSEAPLRVPLVVVVARGGPGAPEGKAAPHDEPKR